MHLRTTLQHYTRIIRQRIGLILTGVVVSATLTCGVSLLLPRVYQARALIQVNGSATATTNDVFSNQALAVGYALLVTNPAVLQAAARGVPGITASQIGRAVSDSPLDNTEIIEIRAQDSDPQRAAAIANAVAATFVQQLTAEDVQRLQGLMDQVSQTLAQSKTAMDTAQQKLTALEDAHADEESITRQRNLLESNQSSYASAQKSYDQFSIQKLQAASMLSIVQTAQPPEQPTSPQVWLNALLAACMSLIVMVLLSLLLDWMDSTLQTADDVIQMAGLEPLGCIPRRKAGDNAARFVDLPPGPIDTTREELGMLGSRFRALNKGHRTILVTGLQARAGVSTTAIHLALSLARSGMRVALIDTNLRHPILHEVFQMPNTHGLTNQLKDVLRFQEQPEKFPLLWLQQWKTPVPNLWMVPSGPLQTHSTAILSQPELRLLKDWLPGQRSTSIQAAPLVDILIFDAPALTEGTDAEILAGIADATILVIEAGREQEAAVQKARTTLQRAGAPLLGVVLNRQEARHRSYFYIDPRGHGSRCVEATTDHEQTTIKQLSDNHATEQGPISSKKHERLLARSLPTTNPPAEPHKAKAAQAGSFKPQFQGLLRVHNGRYSQAGNEQRA
ncbi:MAG TPA: Wzz/FepE/Etk N-terminal domain-containing protein [Ktedonobacteraceae bacterium]|nr:Wzz/FepE/Etk N-terminal domain-containing protein [Ktedonobacteraceae bacterium]